MSWQNGSHFCNDDLEQALNQLSFRYIIDYFMRCGAPIAPGHILTVSELKSLLKIKRKFLPFLTYMLSALKQARYINLHEDKIEFLIDINFLDSINLLVNKTIEKFPTKKELINLLAHFGKNYRKALAEEIFAISVLFPEASTAFLNPVIQAMEALFPMCRFEKFLRKLLYIKSKKVPFTLMEVGGGMGRFTWEIASTLPAQHTKYHFTDLSRFFIVKAKKMAVEKNIHCMEFSQFDITKPPEGQGFKADFVDILFAFNVIHATPDLNVTLRNLKNLISPTGSLILIELSRLPVWLHVIWGFAEGWWHFTDEYRTITPLIEKESLWEQALLNSGYKNIRFFSRKNSLNTSSSLIGMIANK